MIESIVLLVRKLCLCGFFTAAVTALAKETGQKEILRLCCVCLTILVLFRAFPLGKNSGGDLRLGQWRMQTQDLIDQSLDEAKQQQLEEMRTQTEIYLQQQCSIAAGGCKVKVVAKLSKEAAFEIHEVLVENAGENSPDILRILKENGIKPEQIIVS